MTWLVIGVGIYVVTYSLWDGRRFIRDTQKYLRGHTKANEATGENGRRLKYQKRKGK